MIESKLSNNKNKKYQYQTPIPPPNNPKQYRAIGLIYGKYKHDQEKLTTGIIKTKEGQIISAVLLGKTICLVEKHLDLKKNHLWIVYPRIKQETDQFHAQIVGVWQSENDNLLEILLTKHLYFSIRGEVIFNSKHDQKVIIKIPYSTPKNKSNLNFFKLKLMGYLPSDCLGHFFNLDVTLHQDNLVIDKANDLGLLPRKF